MVIRTIRVDRLKHRLDKLPYASLQKFYEMYKTSPNPRKDVLGHARDRITSLRWGLNGRKK